MTTMAEHLASEAEHAETYHDGGHEERGTALARAAATMRTAAVALGDRRPGIEVPAGPADVGEPPSMAPGYSVYAVPDDTAEAVPLDQLKATAMRRELADALGPDVRPRASWEFLLDRVRNLRERVEMASDNVVVSRARWKEAEEAPARLVGTMHRELGNALVAPDANPMSGSWDRLLDRVREQRAAAAVDAFPVRAVPADPRVVAEARALLAQIDELIPGDVADGLDTAGLRRAIERAQQP